MAWKMEIPTGISVFDLFQTFGLGYESLVFICGQVIENLTGIIVNPILQVFNVLICKLADVRAFWNPPADELVCVLIASAFACVVWMAVIDLCAFHYFVVDAFFNSLHVGKLTAIVTGDGLKGFTKDRGRKLSFKAVQNLCQALLVFTGCLKNKFFPCHSFCEDKETGLVTFAGFHGIEFPMSISKTVIDFTGTFFDRCMDMVTGLSFSI